MKVGILGFAHAHVNSYGERWKRMPELDIDVCAGWDHDGDRLADAAARLGFTPLDSPAALLASKDIEAVVIAAETSMHADMVERAARAGKTIVLQKPLALTMEQADRIVNAVRDSGVRFTVAWQMRVDPENLKIRELIQSGALGRIFMIRRRHGLATQRMANFDKAWYVKPAYNRDIWADDSAHPVDFLYWLFGRPVSVMAELGSLWNPKIPNDNGLAVFRYPDGLFAEVSCSFVCVAHENTTEIVAEKGFLTQKYGDGPSAAARPSDGGPSLRWRLHDGGIWEAGEPTGFAGQGDRIANLAQPLAEFMHGRRPPIATAEEGRDVLRMVLATYESHEAGRRVGLGF